MMAGIPLMRLDLFEQKTGRVGGLALLRGLDLFLHLFLVFQQDSIFFSSSCTGELTLPASNLISATSSVALR